MRFLPLQGTLSWLVKMSLASTTGGGWAGGVCRRSLFDDVNVYSCFRFQLRSLWKVWAGAPQDDRLSLRVQGMFTCLVFGTDLLLFWTTEWHYIWDDLLCLPPPDCPKRCIISHIFPCEEGWQCYLDVSFSAFPPPTPQSYFGTQSVKNLQGALIWGKGYDNVRQAHLPTVCATPNHILTNSNVIRGLSRVPSCRPSDPDGPGPARRPCGRELMVLGRPLLVFTLGPATASECVLSAAAIIAPLSYAGDLRPPLGLAHSARR